MENAELKLPEVFENREKRIVHKLFNDHFQNYNVMVL